MYDTKYHLVWAPKYRKWILRGEIRDRAKELFREIAEYHGFEIAGDHVHIFISFPPKYSISKVVGILKAVSAREIRKEFPKVKKQLWGGEFWEDGYFARTVGGKVTAEVIKKYIRFHEHKDEEARAVAVVLKSPVPAGRGFFLLVHERADLTLHV